MRSFPHLLQRFGRDERGAFLVIFAIMAIVLVAVSGAVVDFTYTQTARSRAQDALDAAALALQADISESNAAATIKTEAQKMVTERLADSSITATVNTVTIDTTEGKLGLEAQITVPTAFVQLVGIKSITAQLTSEATQGSKDLEVAVALDITGSMAGSKLTELKSATNSLITDVVKTTQTPTYSRMAIVPWTNSVNVGTSYATGYSVASVRGPEYDGATMTSATWISGTSKTISSISKSSAAVVTTSAAHGFTAGDYIFIATSSGSPGGNVSSLNDKIFKVGTVGSSTTFNLLNTNGTAVSTSSTFSSSGTPKVSKCYDSSCHLLVTTSTAHNLSTGDSVLITGASGTITSISPTFNNSTSTYSPTVHSGTVGTVPSSTTYYLTDYTATNVLYNAYTASTGTSYCVKLGCYYYYFTPSSTYSHDLFTISNCVSERTGTHAYDDVAPSTAYVGYDYPPPAASGNPCVTPALTPLTDNITTLQNTVTNLVAGGSTAGQLGLAWGWYMVSPNFGNLWSSSYYAPAAYGTANLVKAVVLMTDGDFNTAYCSDVISSDSNDGAGSGSDHSNCNATNGASSTQATTLCTAIKTAGITVYTVGFTLGGDTAAQTLLTNCASSPDDFFEADTGTDLTSAFNAIAQKLNELRLSK